MSAKLPQGIPSGIGSELDRLCAGLAGAAGGAVASVVLYGGVARGRYTPGRSDVNVLVVLAEDGGAVLRSISPHLAAARRSIRVEPYILAAAEFQAAALLFPTRFLDMRDHHVVLAGPDPFEGIAIPEEALRLRTEQELRNLLIRFRRAVLEAGEDGLAQAGAVRRVAVPLSIEFAALLRLRGRAPGPEADLGTIFRMAAETLGLDAGVLSEISALREATGAAPDAAGLCDRTIGILHHTNRLAARQGGDACIPSPCSTSS